MIAVGGRGSGCVHMPVLSIAGRCGCSVHLVMREAFKIGSWVGWVCDNVVVDGVMGVLAADRFVSF